jgi:Uma2 family endonuclease
MTGLTWQEFLDLPEEYRHADLVNGELFVNSPAPQHQQIVSRLLTALSRPPTVHTAQTARPQPDLANARPLKLGVRRRTKVEP